MTTMTGPVHIRLSADAPTGQNVYQSSTPLGTISLVSGAGSSGLVMTTAAGVVLLVSGGQNLFARGFTKILVDGTVACVPFFYSTT